jgi:PAS domain S-box-containing protein
VKVEGSTVEINNRKLLQFIAQDITNRKMIEEDLKESEIKFRTISEQFLMGIGILQDEEVKYANLKLANMYGYDVEEFIGKTYSEFLDLIHPEDRAKLIRQVEKRKDRTRDTGVSYQFRAFKKTGELFWANIYSRIINYQGKRAGLLAILDNTEVKMAELNLKESEEKFRKIAEQSFMGIIIRQHDTIEYVNEAAINIFGYSMEDIQEWSFEYITKKHIYPEDLSYIRENRRTERDGNSEIKQFLSYRIITKSGKLRWVDQYSKIFLYQGEISELITIVDITEKKAAERIILEENKKLLELDKIRRDFLIRASHELKTPLNSIYSTSEFLLHYNEAILDEKLKQFLEIIYKGGKRLKMLIENLLDVSRIESAKLELNIAEKNIRKIMDKCIKEVYFLSEKRNITIIFEKSEDILIKLDKVRMEQVFVNILVNAIKNTPNFGEVAIKTLQENDHIKIIVTDTGVGFTEEEKLKTFEKFGKIERYGQGMDIDTEGSGLGLFISKEIVELHGGDIELLSQGRNKGSTFIISLPL